MSKRFKVLLAIVAAVVIAVGSFTAGCITFATPSPGQSTGLDLVKQAWNVIFQDYVDPASINTENLSRGAVRGIMEALNDPYSAYLDPSTYQIFQNNLQGQFEGIGAQVNLNEAKLPVIVAPLPGSPAEKAGLKTGDVILAVDNVTTEGASLMETVLKIRGPAGTPVTLTVLHQGAQAPVDITINRAKINTTSVNSEMKGDIAYIRILQFVEETGTELNDTLKSLDLAASKGIILDLRSNPGGLVSAVVDCAGHFIKDGGVITLVDNKGNRTSESVHSGGVFTDLPMVVLVDEFSASGAEVLTGALHDHKRATVAGIRTFGKGSYDNTIALDDGSYLYLTVGRWLTPNGHLIEGQGIEPDYVLTETGDAEIQWAIDFLHNGPPAISAYPELAEG
jgi:carboxyl-terminal processing protease